MFNIIFDYFLISIVNTFYTLITKITLFISNDIMIQIKVTI